MAIDAVDMEDVLRTEFYSFQIGTYRNQAEIYVTRRRRLEVGVIAEITHLEVGMVFLVCGLENS